MMGYFHQLNGMPVAGRFRSFFWDVFGSKGGDLGDEIPVASIEILPLRARLTPHDQ